MGILGDGTAVCRPLQLGYRLLFVVVVFVVCVAYCRIHDMRQQQKMCHRCRDYLTNDARTCVHSHVAQVAGPVAFFFKNSCRHVVVINDDVPYSTHQLVLVVAVVVVVVVVTVVVST